ncbi:hypothetical protein VCCP10303_0668, partial [Vibrio cholerae CP1030(3)]
MLTQSLLLLSEISFYKLNRTKPA